MSTQIEGYQLSPQQNTLFRRQPPEHPHITQAIWQVEGDLDPLRLHHAIEHVLLRHDILRTTYQKVRGMQLPIQVVSPDISLNWQLEDFRSQESRQQDQRIEQIACQQREQRCELEHGPLLQVTLCVLTSQRAQLIITLPQLNADRQSVNNLLKEIAACYSTSEENVDEDESAEVIQYSQFSAWQQGILEEEHAAAGRLFQQQQDAYAQELQLPGFENESDPGSLTTTVVTKELTSELQHKLEQYALEHEVRVKTIVLAGWQLLMYRLTREPHILVRAQLDGRPYSDFESGIGAYARYVPLSAHFSPASHFLETTRTLESLLQDAEELQEVLIDDDEKQEKKHLFLGFESIEYSEPLQTKTLLFTVQQQATAADQFALKLIFDRSQDKHWSLILYGAEKHTDQAQLERLLGRLCTLLVDALARRTVPANLLQILAPDESLFLLEQVNATQREYPEHACLHQLFEVQVRQRPGQIAVQYGDQALTYQQLNERANQIAHYLRRRGVTSAMLIAVCFEASLDLLATILGIFKAGAAYIPLDPALPLERLTVITHESQPHLLLTQSSLAARVNAVAAERLCIDQLHAELQAEAKTDLNVKLLASNLAYVLFTSGSTGTPKGVMISHQNLMNYLTWCTETYPFEGGQGTLVHSSIGFDLTITSLFTALLVGQRVHIIATGEKIDALCAALETGERYSIIKLTPAHLDLLNWQLSPQALMNCTQALIIGGEALYGQSLERFQHDAPQVRLFNEYGPTETTVGCTIYEVPRQDELPDNVPIGRPVANTKVYVLDTYLNPVPLGMTGDLYIGGAGVARGYLHRPDWTAERFIPDPFSTRPGARLYLTGDRARFLSDGSLEYRGRADHQVKLRGYRIELGEIEATLRQLPLVEECVVLLEGETTEQKQLVSYLVPDREQAFTVQKALQLQESGHLSRQALYELPNGMIVNFLNKNEVLYLYDEIFVSQTYLSHGISLHDGDTIFDVGANIGFFSLFAGYVSRGAHIYAFEPIPPTAKILQTNAMLYNFDIKVFAHGLHNQTTRLPFSYYPHLSLMSSHFADQASEKEVVRNFLLNEQQVEAHESQLVDALLNERLSQKTFLCEVKTLSEVMREEHIEHIDLIKIDVEKSEMDVLMGIEEKDWPKIKQLVIEIHDLGQRIQQVVELLQTHGYQVTVEQERSLEKTELYDIYALRPEQVTASAASNTLEAAYERYGYTSSDRLIDALRSSLQQTLPSYMLPTTFILLDALPLTHNGKLDRQALQARPHELQAQEDFLAPQTLTQVKLAEIWEQVLERSPIGQTSHFFDLGGHSLLVMRLLARVRETFQVELAVQSFFEAPTLVAQAAIIDPARQKGTLLAQPHIGSFARSQDLPLSFSQQRLWFLAQLNPGSSAYNIPCGLRLRGHLRYDALESSFKEVLARHEILRTVYAQKNGEPIQIITPPPSTFVLPVQDFSTLAADQKEAQALQFLQAEADRAFDLQQGPILRVHLIRLQEDEHLLLICVHHIAFDGWSVDVMIRELGEIYLAVCEARPVQLETPTVQYADYAIWQRAWLQGEILEQEISNWKTQLQDAPTILELPTDHPRPVQLSDRGMDLSFHLPAELTRHIKLLGRQEESSLYMTLLAAFAILLARYSGQEDLIVGSPIANRTHKEIEALIGFFVNTLVVRIDVSGMPGFREVLQRVRATTLQAYTHQDLPFERIVEELEVERDMSRSPLVQVTFALQEISDKALNLQAVDVSIVDLIRNTGKSDLNLTMWEEGDVLLGNMEYSTDLFERATIQRMVGHFQTLLQAIVAEPDQAVTDITLLSAEERQQLLLECNNTTRSYPQQATLGAVFTQQAQAHPESIALSFKQVQMNYGELERRSNQLAHHLQARGVRPETLVGVSLERSPLLIIALLGILKAGGAYVPLDPTYPQERLAYMLTDIHTPLILTQQSLVESLPAYAGQLLCLDQDWDTIAQASPLPCNVHLTSDNLAYVIYTSGSTGRPKGVQVTHQSIMRLLFSTNYVHLDEHETLLQLAPIAFDGSIFELWGALLHGAHCVLYPEQTVQIGQLRDLLQKHPVSTVWISTAFFHMLIDEAPAILRDVRQLMVGGEKLSLAHMLRGQQLLPQTQLSNIYGPTETTTFATWYPIPPLLPNERQAIPIGKPISNTQVYILDAQSQPVPIGVVGELYIGGPGVARGYLQQPALTAERFTPDPFSELPGARLYRTGDLVRYDNQQQINFIGRADQQVKIRGFRIELGEIESLLSAQEDVQTAKVLLREESSGEKFLVAYVVAQKEQQLSPTELRERLATILPDYMLPSFFVLLKELPFTANGKIDHAALMALPYIQAGQDDFLAPETHTQKTLAAIWEQVLDYRPVGLKSSFFELGGHSLLVMRLLARIRETFQIDMPVRALFEAATLAGQAKSIEYLQQEQVMHFPQLHPISRTQGIPLSFGQQRLWFMDQFEPDNRAYTISLPLLLEGILHQDLLQQSLRDIVARHEVLRTTFRESDDGQPEQVIAAAPDIFPFTHLDWSGIAEAQQEERIQHLIEQDIQTPFYLQTGPLLRATLVRMQPERYFFLLSLHHIVFDGWSIDIFSQELSEIYRAYYEQRPSTLPDLPIQYADYAYWQKQWLQGETLQHLMSYWKQQLAALPMLLPLPTDRSRPITPVYQSGGHHTVLNLALADSLRQQSRHTATTLFMNLYAAFGLLLHYYSKQEDIVVCTNLANRAHPGLESLLGFFVNQIILRTSIADEARLEDVLQSVRKTALDAYTHQDLPFDLLIQELNPERTSNYSPLSQIKITFMTETLSTQALPDLNVQIIQSQTETSKYDITLVLTDTGQEILATWLYNSALFDETTIAGMAQLYEILLKLSVTHPSERVDEVLWLAERENVKRKNKKPRNQILPSHEYKKKIPARDAGEI